MTDPDIETPPAHPAEPPRLGLSREDRPVFQPPIDIYETAEGLVLEADLPGVRPDDLELQVQDNRLTLFGRVTTPELAGAAAGPLIHSEYAVGDYLRSFILSADVDHERITANLTGGVLRVTLPRIDRGQPRRIAITSG